jgi:hypothetical protein
MSFRDLGARVSKTISERRQTDRRAAHQFTLRWPERRTGFDRRKAYPVLRMLRDSGALLLSVLVLLNVLSLIDLGLTTYELTLGAAEGNPVMRMAFDAGPAAVIAVKVGVMVLVSVGIWWLRRYRRVLQLSVASVGAYAALLVYHVAGLATLA